MKKILAVIWPAILAVALLVGTYGMRVYPKSYESEAKLASGGIFWEGQFHCSGTEIGKTQDGNGIFLTARHCVANTETNALYKNFMVSFSENEGGPYYMARPLALSLTDDLALLELKNGADIPEVKIKDERWLKVGEPIFNISYPLGAGKLKFHGEYMGPSFPHFPVDVLQRYSQWLYAMPMNMTIAHGSSGSGVFSNRERALVGVAVGTFEEGSFNIAIPADRVIDFLHDLQDNTVEKFQYAFPVKEAVLELF